MRSKWQPFGGGGGRRGNGSAICSGASDTKYRGLSATRWTLPASHLGQQNLGKGTSSVRSPWQTPSPPKFLVPPMILSSAGPSYSRCLQTFLCGPPLSLCTSPHKPPHTVSTPFLPHPTPPHPTPSLGPHTSAPRACPAPPPFCPSAPRPPSSPGSGRSG